jgi:hypothetical protein
MRRAFLLSWSLSSMNARNQEDSPEVLEFLDNCFWLWKNPHETKKFKTQKTFLADVGWKNPGKIKKLFHGRLSAGKNFKSLFSGRVWIHWLKNFYLNLQLCPALNSLLDLITIHLLLDFEASTTVCFMLANFEREKHAQQLRQHTDLWRCLQLIEG